MEKKLADQNEIEQELFSFQRCAGSEPPDFLIVESPQGANSLTSTKWKRLREFEDQVSPGNKEKSHGRYGGGNNHEKSKKRTVPGTMDGGKKSHLG